MLFSFSFTFAQSSVKDVSLGFCNDGTWNVSDRYTVMVDPGEKKDLCIYIQNESTWSVQVDYSFPKWFISKWGNQICDTSNNFAQFFVDNPNRSVIVSGNTSVELKETIEAPVGMIGMYYGCLAYQLSTPEVEKMGGVFDLVIRKTSFVNLFVGSEDSVKNIVQFIPVTWDVYSSNKNIGLSFDENGDTILHFAVKNNWNTVQSVSFDGKLYNALGFEKDFSFSWKKLLPEEIYKTTLNLWIMPFYKWLFTVRANLTGTPVFDFDVSMLSDKIKESTTLKEEATIFVFSWVYVVILILLLVVILKIVLPKKKK